MSRTSVFAIILVVEGAIMAYRLINAIASASNYLKAVDFILPVSTIIFEDFRIAEIIAEEADPFDDHDHGQYRLLKRVKEYTPEMLDERVSFDECSFWDQLDIQRDDSPDDEDVNVDIDDDEA